MENGTPGIPELFRNSQSRREKIEPSPVNWASPSTFSSSESEPPSSPTASTQERVVVETSPSQGPGKEFMTSIRTPRASAQFKSPLSAVAPSDPGNRRRAVSASPNVQVL